MSKSSSYNPKTCCGDDCYELEYGPSDEPCWGAVVPISNEPHCDGGHYWVHACQGHKETYFGGEYIKENE